MLNWVPAVEAFQKEITMIPLAVVLTVIGFKDAMEDYRRYRYDKKINNTLTHVYCRSVCVFLQCKVVARMIRTLVFLKIKMVLIVL